MKVWKIISKTMRLIIRSKTSLAAVLLGPLLIITLVGLAFGSINQYSLNIGVYSPEYTDLVESYVNQIDDDETYQVTRYPLADNCINDIRRGTVHTCIEFPADFELGGNESNNVMFYVDQSKTDMVNIIENIIVSRFSERTGEIAEEQTADILTSVDDVNRVINEQLVSLQVIGDDLSSADSDIDSALSSLGDLGDVVSGSGGRLMDINSALGDMLDSAEDMKDEAHDAIDYSLSNLNPNSTQESYLLSRRDDIDGYFNETETHERSALEITADYESDTDGIGDYKDEVEGHVESAGDHVSDAIESMSGVRTEFSDVLGQIEGIDAEGARNITAPVTTEIEPVVAERAPLSYMFPTLLVMVIMLVSIMLAGTLVVMEKTSNSFFRNFVTPTADISFISGIFFTNVIVTLAQTLLIILVASLVFGGAVLVNIPTIAVSLLVIAAFFTLLGMLLGYLFNTQEMVSLSGITIGSLFIMLSGVIIPLEQMPEYMIEYSSYNPLVLGESIMRNAIIFHSNLINETIIGNILLLIGFSLILLFFVIMVQKMKKELFLSGKLFIRKNEKIVDEDDADDKKGGGMMAGLDYLEDYVSDEETKEDDKPKVKGKIKRTLARFTSKFRWKKKEDQLVFAGDEELTYGASSEEKKSSDTSEDDNEKIDADDTESDDDDDGKGSGSGKTKAKGSSSSSKKSSSSSSKKSTKSTKKSSKASSATGDDDSENDVLSDKLEPHQYFVLSSGVIVKSFPDFVEELKDMDEETFEYHVGDGRNDFYLWLKNVLRVDKPADKIRSMDDPKRMYKALKKFL